MSVSFTRAAMAPNSRRFVAFVMAASLVGVFSCSEDEKSDDTKTQDTGETDDAKATEGDAANVGDVTSADAKGADIPALDLALLKAVHAAVSPKRMKTDIDFLASDKLGGRLPGSHGSKLAREYIRDQMKAMGMEPLGHKGGFFHTYAQAPSSGNYMLTKDGKIVPQAMTEATNVVGILRGSDPARAKEHIVLSCHYDHLGVTQKGEVNNGAFDDAGGCVVALEVARALITAKAKPKRPIVFLVTDGEEGGLKGADGWLKDPTVPLNQIVAHMSADPFGRGILPDYKALWFAGGDRSPELQAFVRAVAAKHFTMQAQFVHRDLIPVFASDQDQFYKRKIPALWMFNLGFKFYHTTGDTAETIDYRVMRADAHDLATLLLALTSTDKTFAWLGSKPLTMQNLKDLRTIFLALEKSKAPTAEDRKKIKGFLATWDAAIKAGGPDGVKDFDAQVVSAVVFLVYGLAADHPGPIPPPFPKD